MYKTDPNYEKLLKDALEEIKNWGEERGGHWCREYARQTLASVEEWPNKKHPTHKSVRSSDASTFDFICDDCGATDSVTGGWAGLSKPCSKGETK